jgi:drug/metabolite transporter (DMT)-like permease
MSDDLLDAAGMPRCVVFFSLRACRERKHHALLVMHTDTPFAAHLKLFGMAAVWGASWPWGRMVAQAMPPLTAAGLRFGVASIVLLIWLWHRGGLAALKTWRMQRWIVMLVAAAIGVFGYATCFMLGLRHVPASKAALVITLNPALTLLLAAWLFGERLSGQIGFGMLLAVAGSLVVITHGEPWRLLDGSVGIGQLFLLGCVVCWSIYTLIGRHMLAGIDALTATAVTATLGACMLLISGFCLEGSVGFAAAVTAPLQAWSALLALAFIATAIAYAWYFSGVQMLGAGTAAAYITLVPIFGVLFSSWWLGEMIDASVAIGGGLAIVGMAMMQHGRRA